METNASLPFLKEPSSEPYPSPFESSSHFTPSFFQIHFKINHPPHLTGYLPSSLQPKMLHENKLSRF
jgi:hypothetical protein